MRAAGRVGDDATRPRRVERTGEQVALQRRQPRDVGRLAPPPRLGPAPQRPQAGAGRIDDHPVVRVGLGRADLPAVAGPDRDLTRAAPGDHGGQRWRTRSVRFGLTSLATRSASRSRARPASSPALPPGPAHRSSQRSRPEVALDRCRGEGQGDQLRPLVLHCGSSLAHGRDRPRVPVVEDNGGPGQRGERGAVPQQLAHVGETRPGHERHPRRRVVRRQERVELRVHVVGGRAAVTEQGLPKGADHPLGMAGPHGRCRQRLQAGGATSSSHASRSRSDTAQHRVEEPGRADPVDLSGQGHGLVDRGVGGDPHTEQLVDPQPERVEDRTVDLRRRSLRGDLDHPVVEPAHPRCAVDQLGRERRRDGRSASPATPSAARGQQSVVSSSAWFRSSVWDTDLSPAMEALAGRVDVAALPVWGWGARVPPGHLNPERAAQAAALIRPRLAIPIHWGTLVAISSQRGMDPLEPPGAFADAVARIAPEVEVRILMAGERANCYWSDMATPRACSGSTR